MIRWKLTLAALALACMATGQALDVQQLAPAGHVPQFGKAEWGVKPPASVMNQIADFLQDEGGFNPFDPAQVDVGAAIQQRDSAGVWQPVDTVYAFYYENFRRSHPVVKPAASYNDNNKPNNYGRWNWQQRPNAFPFRVRYAPRSAGEYRVQFYVTATGATWNSLWKPFTCTASDHPGYVQKAANRPYLEYANGDLFFPIGHNDNPLDAETDWLLSYKKNKQTGEYCCDACVESKQPWGKTQWSPVPLAMVSFLILQDHLYTLKHNGGNTVRLIGRPYGFELEYETLGNYQNRLHIGWELDELVQLAEELEIKIQFCMDDQYSLEIDQSFGFYEWDWFDDYKPGKKQASNQGYCYHTTLGLEKPIDFLRDAEAKRWYKNRLRYYYARWGYSPAISAFELVSEVNGVNKTKQGPNYGDDPELQRAIGLWQQEMARYIKNELGHTWHLLGVSYLVSGAFGEDISYDLPEVDIHCESHYFTTFHDHVSLGNRTNGITTPLLWTEYGFGDKEMSCSRPVNGLKCSLLSPFTGVAGVGMHWDHQFNADTGHWAVYQHIDRFISELDLNRADWNSYGDLRNDDLASAVYLLTGDAKAQTSRVVGAVYNHTWNEYSKRACLEACHEVPESCLCDSLQWNAWTVKESLREPRPIDYSGKGTQRLEVKELQGKAFKGRTLYIRWYSPFTGEYSEVSEVRRKWGGKVELVHPTLDPESNPILFFELWGEGVDGVR